MGLTKQEAFKILELPTDASFQDVLRSYKTLALHWYPEKHKDNPIAVMKFQKISQAYKTLTSSQKEPCQSLTMREMLSLFQEVFFGDENLYDGDESSDSSDDSILLEIEMDNLADHLSNTNFHIPKQVTAEEAKSNAEALIAEEEKEKKRAEKKKAKKKRQKLKKKLEKVSSDRKEVKNTNGAPETRLGDKDDETSENSDLDNEEDLDLNSAFVAVIANKKKKDVLTSLKKTQVKEPCKGIEAGERNEISPTVLRSRQVAIRGNQMASIGHYQEAIDLFTEAIKLNPVDYRFYGNRSYCFDRLEQFERAFKDAEKSIILSSKWPKGYFRKGRALSGLKKYDQAQKAFEEVLRLDKDCEDAVQEILKIKALQANKDISRQSDTQPCTTVKAAFVTGATSSDWKTSEDDIYRSDDDDSVQAHPRISAHLVDEKMDPRNPEGHTSIWVGNVTQVTEKMLFSIFSKFGNLLSIRVLPDKFCAFINYSDKWSASRAMFSLQGKEINGQHLIIRYPDNPSSVTVLRKNRGSISSFKTLAPVNGNECHFWRTTGCIYGDNCRYKHIREHQGIDEKIWNETKTS